TRVIDAVCPRESGRVLATLIRRFGTSRTTGSASHEIREQRLTAASVLQLATVTIVGLFVVYNLFHYILFLLVTHPRDARKTGHQLNEFERRQLAEWTPGADDRLKHDDENRSYDDIFGAYRTERANYSTCVFPRMAFTYPYAAEW